GTNITITVVGTATNTAGHCEGSFDATRTWRAADPCGNSSQCSQTVIIADTTAPVINCGNTNKTAELGSAWSFDPPTATDNSGTNITITVLSTVTNSAGHCGNTFDVTRTWQATDRCGNSSQCSQKVNLVDTTPPVITCRSNKTAQCGAAWSFDPPSATDASGSTTITVVSTITNSTCGNTFSATRTWRATDRCGNSSQCSHTVAITDTIAPTITCSSNN